MTTMPMRCCSASSFSTSGTTFIKTSAYVAAFLLLMMHDLAFIGGVECAEVTLTSLAAVKYTETAPAGRDSGRIDGFGGSSRPFINTPLISDELIPRDMLFQNLDHSGAQISHDGTYISFLAPRNAQEDVMNVWAVATKLMQSSRVISKTNISYLTWLDWLRSDAGTMYTDMNAALRMVTDERTRSIGGYLWAPDNQHILYQQDSNGDENWHIYSVSVATRKTRDITPVTQSNAYISIASIPIPNRLIQRNVQARILHVSVKFPNEILVLLNDRSPAVFDVYRVNITNGEKKQVYKNTARFVSFQADDDYNIRLAVKPTAGGGAEIYVFDATTPLGGQGAPRIFQRIPAEDISTSGPLHISSDGKKLFVLDSVGRNTAALVEVDLQTLDRKTIYHDPLAAVAGLLVDSKSKELVLGVVTQRARSEWIMLDTELPAEKSVTADFAYLRTVDDGDISVVSKTMEDDMWIVLFHKSNAPPRFYLYDRSSSASQDDEPAVLLFTSNAKQEGMPFSKMHPVTIPARDGLELVSYLTVPRWLDNGDGIPVHPVPCVLLVHGGPKLRDSWGFSGEVQWLANRGYAVLNVNYRGSAGFGKEFLGAGDGEWAGKMQDDLTDAVRWAVENNVALPEKVCIMGASYGGYATLVGLTMTPTQYACGIDIMGPSNLITLQKTLPAYWEAAKEGIQKMMGGSYNTKEGRQILREKSPLTYAGNIVRPLMIVQGANDPRVKRRESDQILHYLKDHGTPVIYLLYPDEGHGLVRTENRLSTYAIAEIFLAKFLGGRFSDVDPAVSFANSSGKILHDNVIFGNGD